MSVGGMRLRRLNQMGGRVRAVRTELKLTQAEFAHELGITVGTVNRWENDRFRPSKLAMTVLFDIARSRGVAVNTIFNAAPQRGAVRSRRSM